MEPASRNSPQDGQPSAGHAVGTPPPRGDAAPAAAAQPPANPGPQPPADLEPPPVESEPPRTKVAPPKRDPAWYRPILVLAPARSNSSIVSSMIGMHPELYGFPELALFRGANVAELLVNPPGFRGLPERARLAGLVRTLAELHEGKQDLDSIARATDWLRDRDSWEVAAVFDHLLGLVAPLVAIEKSPEDSNREDFLERIDESYPRARYLHVTRHPVPTVKSMHEAWSRAGYWDVPDDLFHLHLLGTWMFHHARIKRFTEALPPDRWMRVRSEDVLNHPQPTLERICKWLGVDSGEASIEAMLHPEKSPYARIGPDNARGGNDPGFLRGPVPRPTALPVSLDLPEEWVVDPWLYLAVVLFAATIGYRHEPVASAERGAEDPADDC